MADLTPEALSELRAVLARFVELKAREYRPFPDHEWSAASKDFGRLCSPERISALLDQAAEAMAARWIPCSERMPEPTDEFDPGRNVLVVMVLEDIEDLHVIDCTFWYGPGCCDDGTSAWHEARGRVTHWRELPAYPERAK